MLAWRKSIAGVERRLPNAPGGPPIGGVSIFPVRPSPIEKSLSPILKIERRVRLRRASPLLRSGSVFCADRWGVDRSRGRQGEQTVPTGCSPCLAPFSCPGRPSDLNPVQSGSFGGNARSPRALSPHAKAAHRHYPRYPPDHQPDGAVLATCLSHDRTMVGCRGGSAYRSGWPRHACQLAICQKRG